MEADEQGQSMDIIMKEQETDAPVKAEDSKSTYRSFKKKYKKMRIKFDEDMRKSNELFLIEQQAEATVKRLAQMNNQILDLLLDVNSSPHIPSDKRIDLSAAHPTLTPIPPLISPTSLSALATSQDQPLATSIQTTLSAKAQQAALTNSTASKSLSTLLTTTPHPSSATNSSSHLLTDLDPLPLRHLTMEQIDKYLDELDNSSLSQEPLTQQAQNITLTHQELFSSNPHSVNNWLLAHQPKGFLQDGEGSDKSTSKPGALRGAGKRGGVVHATPVKAEILEGAGGEEDGGTGLDVAMEGVTPGGKGKGKRKRGGDDEDSGYHPKQGRVEDGKGKKTRKPRAKKGEEGAATPASASASKRSRKSKAATSTVSGDAGVVVKEEGSLES